MPGGHYCPDCDTELDWEDDDPDVGIVGGWFCPKCEKPVEGDYPDQYFDP